jgi:hypothetical protein
MSARTRRTLTYLGLLAENTQPVLSRGIYIALGWLLAAGGTIALVLFLLLGDPATKALVGCVTVITLGLINAAIGHRRLGRLRNER